MFQIMEHGLRELQLVEWEARPHGSAQPPADMVDDLAPLAFVPYPRAAYGAVRGGYRHSAHRPPPKVLPFALKPRLGADVPDSMALRIGPMPTLSRPTSAVAAAVDVIDGAPQVHALASDGADHLVQMPPRRRRRPTALQVAIKRRAELDRPTADGLVRTVVSELLARVTQAQRVCSEFATLG
jgi:hypothetical protein